MLAGIVQAEPIHLNNQQSNYLAKPSGDYAVGFQDFRLVNGVINAEGAYECPGKTDSLYFPGINESSFGKDNQINFCREIMVRVYYPTQKERSPSFENYYLPAINDLQNTIRQEKNPKISEQNIKALTRLTTYTVKKSDLLDNKFPVLLFNPGSGDEAEEYENTIDDLVSHGYIVMGINNTFISSSVLFPDGRIVTRTTSASLPVKDQSVLDNILIARFALNHASTYFPMPLVNAMDLNHIGLFGHSMGGISVVAVGKNYPNLFQAAASEDAPPVSFGTRTYDPAAMQGFKSLPFLRLYAAEWRTLAGIITPPDAQFKLYPNNYYALLNSNENSPPPYYTDHANFTDHSTLQYQPTISKYLSALPPSTSFDIGTADGWHVTRLINAYLLQFFDQYLKNKPSHALKKCQPIVRDKIIGDTMLHCGERPSQSFSRDYQASK